MPEKWKELQNRYNIFKNLQEGLLDYNDNKTVIVPLKITQAEFELLEKYLNFNGAWKDFLKNYKLQKTEAKTAKQIINAHSFLYSNKPELIETIALEILLYGDENLFLTVIPQVEIAVLKPALKKAGLLLKKEAFEKSAPLFDNQSPVELLKTKLPNYKVEYLKNQISLNTIINYNVQDYIDAGMNQFLFIRNDIDLGSIEIILKLNNLNLNSLTGIKNLIENQDHQYVSEIETLNNNLTKIEDTTFDTFTHLLFVDLSSNKLTNDVFKSLKNIPKIDLIKLNKNCLSGTLELHPQKQELTLLTHLLLTDNNIENVEINNLPFLYQIDLTNNSIRSINSKSFVNLPRLTNIYLTNNEITSITNDSFNNLPVLENIILFQNPIRANNIEPLQDSIQATIDINSDSEDGYDGDYEDEFENNEL